MRTVRTSEDIVPVSELKARAADLLKRVGATGQPIVIMQNGKPAGVLVSPAEYDRLVERTRSVRAVEDGIADADAGRLSDHGEVAARMKQRYGKRRFA